VLNRLTFALLSLPLLALGQDSAVSAESYYFGDNTRPPDAYLSLRSLPSSDRGQRIAAMPNGTLLEVLQRRNDDWWYVRIVSTGQEGWALRGEGNRVWIVCCQTVGGLGEQAPVDRQEGAASTRGIVAPTATNAVSAPVAANTDPFKDPFTCDGKLYKNIYDPDGSNKKGHLAVGCSIPKGKGEAPDVNLDTLSPDELHRVHEVCRMNHHCRIQVLANSSTKYDDTVDAIKLLHITDKPKFSWE
jgi:hypothetical protein